MAADYEKVVGLSVRHRQAGDIVVTTVERAVRNALRNPTGRSLSCDGFPFAKVLKRNTEPAR
jgi:hypothetical protein